MIAQAAYQYRLLNIQTGDLVRFRNRDGRVSTDMVAGWLDYSAGDKRIVLRSRAAIVLADVVSRIRQGNELIFEAWHQAVEA
jgi:hypothetical protein